MSKIQSVLISEQTIAEKVNEIAIQISEDYKGKDLLLVGILKGSVVFLADLMRRITIPVSIDFMAISSYGNGTVSEDICILKDLDSNIDGRHILIIEDILDTGKTLRRIVDLLSCKNPASVNICALLDKPDRRLVDIECKYKPIVIPDEFVVGYGMDCAEAYRNLPYIGILSPCMTG